MCMHARYVVIIIVVDGIDKNAWRRDVNSANVL